MSSINEQLAILKGQTIDRIEHFTEYDEDNDISTVSLIINDYTFEVLIDWPENGEPKVFFYKARGGRRVSDNLDDLRRDKWIESGGECGRCWKKFGFHEYPPCWDCPHGQIPDEEKEEE